MPQCDIQDSRIAHIMRASHMRLCSLFQAPKGTFNFVLLYLPPLSLPPSLVNLVNNGLVSISNDWLSVTVTSGWLLLAELPWKPACNAQDLLLKAHCLP